MANSSNTVNNYVFNPNAKPLFNRTYAIALGPAGQTAALQYANFPITIGGKKVDSSPLRVLFDIDCNNVPTPNKAKFEIYNLSQQSRSTFKPGYIIQFQAGYNGLMDTLYLGNVLPQGTKTVRKGPDFVTSFECGAGESAIVMARLDKSYPAGTSITQVLSDLGNAMGLNSVTTDGGIGAGVALGIPQTVYARGKTVHGSCSNTLTTLLKPLGLQWSVQNGNLQILPVTGYNGRQAIVIASGSNVVSQTKQTVFNPRNATGLIGTPSMAGGYMTFTSLLNPSIIPGALVQLVCEDVSLQGFYTIVRSHFEGDTHGNKWQVSCEANLQNNITQDLPVAAGFDYTPAAIA